MPIKQALIGLIYPAGSRQQCARCGEVEALDTGNQQDICGPLKTKGKRGRSGVTERMGKRETDRQTDRDRETYSQSAETGNEREVRLGGTMRERETETDWGSEVEGEGKTEGGWEQGERGGWYIDAE